MQAAVANRRLQVLLRILQHNKYGINCSNVRAYVTGTKVTIGEVTKNVKHTNRKEYVPQNYYGDQQNQSTLYHLQWMMQKDILGQDIFLIGPPGPRKRNLAMQYLELTNRELEYVALSRDTTESDLKQRREIVNGSATYFDQSAVRAAIKGRILILEGIEKAERNVLPVLNNLLENREMNLEDGRMLIPAKRYDKLLEVYNKEELDKWKLVRVDEDFRIIALGLPVPRYMGNPLDPPLRSRFQARDINISSYQMCPVYKEVNYPRWESSQKSLFVRTVWAEGCRHVILCENDRINKYLKLPSKSSRASSSSLKNNTIYKTTKRTNWNNFQVSPMKIILSGIRNLTKEECLQSRRSFREIPCSGVLKTITINVIPNDKVKFKTINDDIVITPSKRFDTVNLLKAFKLPRDFDENHLEEHIKENDYNKSYKFPHLLTSSPIYHFESFPDYTNSTLSDRVLTWLDLAVQRIENNEENLNITPELKSELLSHKSKGHPHQLQTNLRRNHPQDTKSFNRSRSCEYHESRGPTPTTHLIKANDAPKTNSIEDNTLICERIRDLKLSIPQIESREEATQIHPQTSQRCKNKTEILKRQLHIFMPNISKRNEDCDSTVSDKSSLLKRSSL